MKKTPTIFKRNPENMKELLNEAHPDCAWVFAGEGVATRKYDGTCCLVAGNELWKRREIKKGKPEPDGFLIADNDKITGKTVGWMPVFEDSKEDRWHIEAFEENLKDGTYELIGEKVQGNPECIEGHKLISHADAETYKDAPRTFEGLRDFMANMDIEGIVFHHPDGRMAKIKKRDYGQRRK